MSGNVIEFPVGFSDRRKVTPYQTYMGVAVDVAVFIHDLIIDGLNSGEFLDDEDGPCAALSQFLRDKHGGDRAAAAEGCFEMIYGTDPYTFLMHVANSMTLKAPLDRPSG